jgi:hypothetical protein
MTRHYPVKTLREVLRERREHHRDKEPIVEFRHPARE